MRVYKDNFPFLKEGENKKNTPAREAFNSKHKKENNPETPKENKEREVSLENYPKKTGEEKIKDFKNMQDKRRIKDNLVKERNTEKHIEELKPKEKKIERRFWSFCPRRSMILTV